MSDIYIYIYQIYIYVRYIFRKHLMSFNDITSTPIDSTSPLQQVYAYCNLGQGKARVNN